MSPMAMMIVSSSIIRGDPNTAELTSPFLLDVANAPIRVFLLNISMTDFLSMVPPYIRSWGGGRENESRVADFWVLSLELLWIRSVFCLFCNPELSIPVHP
ncbi:hypothetical protein DESC_190072 [Desulfosarcina cetonica]|nr:hypothetical protein DESC_190072 [Desulfosarcina cetonica]